jgi:hypothetical protein
MRESIVMANRKLSSEICFNAGTPQERIVTVRLKRAGSYFCTAKEVQLAMMDVLISDEHGEVPAGRVCRRYQRENIREKGYFYWAGDYPSSSHYPALTAHEVLDRIVKDLAGRVQ